MAKSRCPHEASLRVSSPLLAGRIHGLAHDKTQCHVLVHDPSSTSGTLCMTPNAFFNWAICASLRLSAFVIRRGNKQLRPRFPNRANSLQTRLDLFLHTGVDSHIHIPRLCQLLSVCFKVRVH